MSERIRVSATYLFGIEAGLKGLRGGLIQQVDEAQLRNMAEEALTRLINKHPTDADRKLLADADDVRAIEQGLMDVCSATRRGAPSSAVVKQLDDVLDSLRALDTTVEQGHAYLCVVLSTNSPAFEDVGPEVETGRLLRQVADAYEQSEGARFRHVLEDTNGRVVGIASWSAKAPVEAAPEPGVIRIVVPAHPELWRTADSLRALVVKAEAQQQYGAERHSPEPN